MQVIYLDVDQVLADWSGGLYRLLNVRREDVLARLPEGEWDVCTALPGYSKSAAWRKIDAAGAAFWEGLDLLPWAHELHDLCMSLAPTYLLTSPSLHPSSYAGKAAWVHKHFGSRFRNVILTSAKEQCARPGALLIDDRPKNCTKFVQHCGDAILFPAHGNEHAEHENDPMPFIRRELWLRLRLH